MFQIMIPIKTLACHNKHQFPTEKKNLLLHSEFLVCKVQQGQMEKSMFMSHLLAYYATVR